MLGISLNFINSTSLVIDIDNEKWGTNQYHLQLILDSILLCHRIIFLFLSLGNGHLKENITTDHEKLYLK